MAHRSFRSDAGMITLAFVFLFVLGLALAMPAGAAIEVTTSFVDDPVFPGNTATLEYSITNTFSGTVTDILFLHTIHGIPSNLGNTPGNVNSPCGVGSKIQGGLPSGIQFIFGELAGGASCTFSIDINLGAALPPGTYNSSIDSFSGKLQPSGTTVTGSVYADSLRVNSLTLTREFVAGPVRPGKPIPVRYTIRNGYAEEAGSLGFTDDLAGALAGITFTGLPVIDPCGPGSVFMDATGPMQLVGGTVPAGQSCSFDVDVRIPEGTAPQTYLLESGPISGILQPSGTPVSGFPASETLLLRPVPGDWDGDGRADMVWRNSRTGQGVVAYFNNADLAGLDPLPKAPAGWGMVAADDFNKDGRMDLLWEDTARGAYTATFFQGAKFLGIGALPPVPPPWEIVATGDFNGDSEADLVLYNGDTGQVGALFLDGVTMIGTNVLATAPPPWMVEGAGDMDGDGEDDLLARNPVTGAVVVAYFKGGALGKIAPLPAAEAPWRIIGVLDHDGDNRTDILLHNPTTGENEAWYMNDTIRLGTGKLPTAPAGWAGFSGRR
jgi:hypothetical protein